MKFRFILVLIVFLSVTAGLNGCGGSGFTPVGPGPSPTATPAPTPSFSLIMAGGDISCDSATPALPCKSKETSDLMVEARRDNPSSIVLPLGDLQYEDGTFSEYRANYDRTWGRLNEVAHPVPGNHEYQTRNATGYFDYFLQAGVATGPRSDGYYQFDFDNWHFVALNSNCDFIGGCGVNSAQYRWLQADLAANRKRCILAYAHFPLFSSGTSGNNPVLQPMMNLLYAAGVDIVLAGHDHNYERFNLMTDAGVADPQRGFRLFVVGTGGRDLYPLTRSPHPLSLARVNDHYGVLKIRIKETAYEWAFTSINKNPLGENIVVDTGTGTCSP